jgi:hypothetical protein
MVEFLHAKNADFWLVLFDRLDRLVKLQLLAPAWRLSRTGRASRGSVTAVTGPETWPTTASSQLVRSSMSARHVPDAP